MSGSGRSSRGINNAPAWMQSGGSSNSSSKRGPSPPPRGGGDRDRPSHSDSHRDDPYRMKNRSASSSASSSAHRDRDRGRSSRDYPSYGGGGGGSGNHPYHHHSGPPRRDPRYHNDYYNYNPDMHSGIPPPPPLDFRREQRSRDRGGGPPPPPPPHRRMGGGGGGPIVSTLKLIRFHSRDEEMDWVEDRRRKRKLRTSKFDVLPTLQQQQQQLNNNGLAVSSLGLGEGGSIGAVMCLPALTNSSAAASNVPMSSLSSTTSPSSLMLANLTGPMLQQQTRHARRLYVGNLPVPINENEIHQSFYHAIRTCLVPTPNDPFEDPVVTVYINQERRFAFVEFTSVELTTACMQLDGLDIKGMPAKIKRPNDYNDVLALALAPTLGPIPTLDVSRLGIISNTVLDGPDKVFVGGLPYHLREDHVLDLLSAFGKVKAFHLVKNDTSTSGTNQNININNNMMMNMDVSSSLTGDQAHLNYSKGYCFVQYADSNTTLVAVAGLNGMDLGGGKTLTVRLAGDRSGYTSTTHTTAGLANPSSPASMMNTATTSTPIQYAIQGNGAGIVSTNIVGGTPIATPSPGATGHPAPPPMHTIVTGYDVEEMVDAALGRCPMPLSPTYFDPMTGIPLTRVVPAMWRMASLSTAATAPNGTAPILPPLPPPPPPPPPPPSPLRSLLSPGSIFPGVAPFPQSSSNNDASSPLPPLPPPPPLPPLNNISEEDDVPTSVLVLSNMVTPEDLATDDDHQALTEEVREECAKFGTLQTVLIPRAKENKKGKGADLNNKNGVGKIYLQYASVADAQAALRELHGRQFGEATVECRFYPLNDFMAGRFQ